MLNQLVRHTAKFNDIDLAFETGKLAFRADSSVFATYGKTTVLVTLTVDKNKSDQDFFPLTVEFVDKHYAVGRINQNKFLKREKQSDDSILKARAIDRAIRPLFPKTFKQPVQIIVTLLTYDGVTDPMVLALNAVSACIMTSSVPFSGPVAAIRVGKVGNDLKLNPTREEMKKSELDLLFSGFKNEISMIEVEANQVSEERMKEAFDLATKGFAEFEKFQNDFASKVLEISKKAKLPVISEDVDYHKVIEKLGVSEEKFIESLKLALYTDNDETYTTKIDEIKKDLIIKRDELKNNSESLQSQSELNVTDSTIDELIFKYSRKIARSGVLVEGKRLSGREMDEIRKLNMEVGVLPIVHGSALFSRGITQAMSVVTLGSLQDYELSESYEGESEKYYIHHYNGPSYSLGEAGKFNLNPGRREIGHGELAEKALRSVIPDISVFPYTIRVVSEVLSQSGSSSMASTCGSTLALMDAGVPIKAPVAGIAIGLVTDDNDKSNYKLVVDMADKEDFFGDMDFKVTGTSMGITAIQMDNKLGGVDVEVLKKALDVAFVKRVEILEKIEKVIAKPNEHLKENAPQVKMMQINPEKIGLLIGPGGKNIKALTEETGSSVDIKDNGLVTITAKDKVSLEKTFGMIDDMVGEAEVGKTYEAQVETVKEYGAFVSFRNGNSQALLHISEFPKVIGANGLQIAKSYKIGEKVNVLVKGVDREGRLVIGMAK